MYIGVKGEKNQRKVKHKSGKIISKWFTRTIYFFKCDNCGSRFSRAANAIGHKKRLSPQYKHFCSECFSPKLAADLGRDTYRKNLDKRIGDRQVDSCGYMTIYVANTHAHSDGYCGRIREHILKMENYLGRSLEKGEVVHHVDGDKLNNEIENLDLCSVGQHNACHACSEQIVFELYKRGLVGYDRTNKKYFLKD